MAGPGSGFLGSFVCYWFIAILSDSRGVALVLKKWLKKGRLPDAVVIEHPAHTGGHLGATNLAGLNDGCFDFLRILEELDTVFTSRGVSREDVPLIVAGRVNSHEAVRALLNAGVNGVPLGTRSPSLKTAMRIPTLSAPSPKQHPTTPSNSSA